MRYIWSAMVLLFLPLAVFAQTSDPVMRSGPVKDVVRTIAGTKNKYVEVVLNDLREFRGKIVAVHDDIFILKLKKIKTSVKVKVISIGNVPNNQTRNKRIKYGDVLQIEGKDAAISFVPDPAASPYSTWDGVSSLVRGDFLQVHRSTGGRIHGVYYRSTPDSLSLMKGNNEVVVPAVEITKVYRVKGDTRSLARKILTGGTLGAKITEDGFPIWDPRLYRHPIGVVIGPAVGATLFVLSIGKTQRVLVYSQ